MNRKIAFGFWLMAFGFLPAAAQRVLSLDSCRQMALRNNKQLSISKMKQDVAANERKSARTKFLPHVNALGTYVHTTKEVSILNDNQKFALSNVGTGLVSQIPAPMQEKLAGLQTALNALGQDVVDAFRTDTRDMFAGTIALTQPIFMGGSIIAFNKIADIKERIAANSLDASRQSTLYTIDQAYWQVVSLHHKKQLAQSYLDLVKKLDVDVRKMIDEGVATKSDGLSVDVKVNEAEMTLTKVNDGLVLSRMLLNQLCGLPLDEQVTLADELAENIAVVEISAKPDVEMAVANRPELKLLENTVALSKQATNVLKAPNVFNGFEKKFSGMWNVGVSVRVPIWNWGDVMYKVRASKGTTAIVNLELADAREKIELQVNQTAFKVEEANKKLAMAQSNILRADENLRMANLGFREGVITPTTVMEAQTAWLQAQSQKIDAEIDVKLSQVDLQKALGTLE